MKNIKKIMEIESLEIVLQKMSEEPITFGISRNEKDYFNILKNLQRPDYRGFLIYSDKYIQMIKQRME